MATIEFTRIVKQFVTIEVEEDAVVALLNFYAIGDDSQTVPDRLNYLTWYGTQDGYAAFADELQALDGTAQVVVEYDHDLDGTDGFDEYEEDEEDDDSEDDDDQGDLDNADTLELIDRF